MSDGMSRLTAVLGVVLISTTCTPVTIPPSPTIPRAVTSSPAPDPSIRGPYAVGLMKRTYQRTSTFDGSVRDHETFIWYPATLTAAQVQDPDGNLDAPVNRSDAPYPLVMWSHGLASTPERSTTLIGHLVSRGFVVVAPIHISDCQTPNLAAQTGSARICLSEAAIQRVDQERPADLVAVLDAVLRDERLESLVDRDRIGAAGYSQGGLTAVQVVAIDGRFKAALGLAPAFNGPLQPVKVPVMLMAGTVDGLVNIEMVQTRYGELPSSTPKWLLTFWGAGHSHFQNGGCNARSVVGITCEQSMPHDGAQVLIKRWAAAFLLRYVAGKPGYDGYLSASRDRVPGSTGSPDVIVYSGGTR